MPVNALLCTSIQPKTFIPSFFFRERKANVVEVSFLKQDNDKLSEKKFLSSSTPIRRSVLHWKEKTYDEITDSKIGNLQFDMDITHWYFLSFYLSLLRERIAWEENDTLRLNYLKQKKNIRFTIYLNSVFGLSAKIICPYLLR